MPPRMAPGRRDAELADLPITSLTRFPGNARRGSTEDIRASIRRVGQYRAIVVRDCPEGLVILAGNHTRDALEAEGYEAARCEVIRCTDDEARRIALADNKLAELGGYDDDALVELLSYLDDDYEGTGWTEEDVEALITPPEPLPPGAGDPDDAPEAPADPVSKPGDVYALAQHRLLVGDATDMAAVEAMMNGDRADCMWTDPPYGVEYVGKTKDALTIRNDGADDLAGLLAGAWAAASPSSRPGGSSAKGSSGSKTRWSSGTVTTTSSTSPSCSATPTATRGDVGAAAEAGTETTRRPASSRSTSHPAARSTQP
jgi:hypothetical protein